MWLCAVVLTFVVLRHVGVVTESVSFRLGRRLGQEPALDLDGVFAFLYDTHVRSVPSGFRVAAASVPSTSVSSPSPTQPSPTQPPGQQVTTATAQMSPGTAASIAGASAAAATLALSGVGFGLYAWFNEQVGDKPSGKVNDSSSTLFPDDSFFSRNHAADRRPQIEMFVGRDAVNRAAEDGGGSTYRSGNGGEEISVWHPESRLQQCYSYDESREEEEMENRVVADVIMSCYGVDPSDKRVGARCIIDTSFEWHEVSAELGTGETQVSPKRAVTIHTGSGASHSSTDDDSCCVRDVRGSRRRAVSGHRESAELQGRIRRCHTVARGELSPDVGGLDRRRIRSKTSADGLTDLSGLGGLTGLRSEFAKSPPIPLHHCEDIHHDADDDSPESIVIHDDDDDYRTGFGSTGGIFATCTSTGTHVNAVVSPRLLSRRKSFIRAPFRRSHTHAVDIADEVGAITTPPAAPRSARYPRQMRLPSPRLKGKTSPTNTGKQGRKVPELPMEDLIVEAENCWDDGAIDSP